MQVHWAYIGCTKEDEEALQRCWDARQFRLHARAEAMENEPVALQIVASRHEGAPQWRFQLAFYLPGRTVVVEDGGDDPGEAMDNMLADLMHRVERLEERPEKVTVRREGLHAVIPLLERCRREGRSDVFFAWLTPLMGSLASHVRRELRTREREREIPPGRIEPSDVLDEVLVQTHDQFDRRPAKLPLDLWLLQLADQALDRAAQNVAEVSLEEQVPQPSEEPHESQRDRWIEWATVAETIDLADVLPGTPTPDRWDSLDAEAKQVEMDRLLSRLPRIQRQALVLHAVYGFSPAEIADFQNRPETEIVFEVNEARRILGQQFREETLFTTEEQMERS